MSGHDPYGTGPGTAGDPAPGATALKRIRIPHLQAMKERGERWAMLTAYDQYAAEIFDAAGIPVLLVGDSAGNNVYGYETTLPVPVDAVTPLVRAVSRGARRSLVVPAVELLTQAGIPVMAHVGFTPQSEHALGGYRVQGRGDSADTRVQDACELEKAG